MVGDYYRYAAESAQGDQLTQVKQGAKEGYQKAEEYAANLNPCNPIKLGLALNLSVFLYETLDDKKKSLQIGEEALTKALDNIDDVDEDTFRDCKSIIELLKENLSLWKEEEGDDGAIEDL